MHQHALSVGNQNEAIQWIQEFQNSPQAINASLYVLKMSGNNGAILFGVMKLLVQRILIGWPSLISFWNIHLVYPFTINR